ncbi:hypothetical protein BSR42_13025 [Megasphaera cerevisiae]|nr:hypothetical protein BSR42_13025 [Megasphaera cerevisiae]
MGLLEFTHKILYYPKMMKTKVGGHSIIDSHIILVIVLLYLLIFTFSSYIIHIFFIYFVYN